MPKEIQILLIDVRAGSDPQKTILHFIIEYMDAAYSLEIDFYTELQPLEDASDLQQINLFVMN